MVNVNEPEDADQVALHDISVRFGRQQVLRELMLSVPRGQTLAVIGESGCGKTVLLKTLIGLIRPTRGYVTYEERRLDQLGDKELTRLRTRFGFVFQQAALFDSMTIAENIEFPLREHHETSRAEARTAARELMA